MRKLVRKSYSAVVPIANTCSIGYPHDSRADNAAYRHDRRADNAANRHDRRADSLSPSRQRSLVESHDERGRNPFDYPTSQEIMFHGPCFTDDMERRGQKAGNILVH